MFSIPPAGWVRAVQEKSNRAGGYLARPENLRAAASEGWIVEETARECEALFHPCRVGLEPSIRLVGQSHLVQNGRDAPSRRRRREVMQRGKEQQILPA